MPTSPVDLNQHTLASEVTIAGRALFAGVDVSVTIRPAPEGAGLRFRRMDAPGAIEIPATLEHVVERPRRSALERSGASVELVEHCLSALAGMGIDNALIDVTGPEPPVGDGSALHFVEAIRRAGVRRQSASRNMLRVREPVVVREGETLAAALPVEGDRSEYLYVLDYGAGSPLGRQTHWLELTPEVYEREIAPARTYSTLAEATAMWNHGMFRGFTARDMLVIGDHGPVDNTYRFDNEPARHKLLDLIGDLALAGTPMLGRFVAVRSGHALNHRLAREVLRSARPGVAATERTDEASLLNELGRRFPASFVEQIGAHLIRRAG